MLGRLTRQAARNELAKILHSRNQGPLRIRQTEALSSVSCCQPLTRADAMSTSGFRAAAGTVTVRRLHTSRSFFDEVHTVECPAFAESISEGDIRWEKEVGDAVEVDEVICEVETDKTSVPVPSRVAGVIEEILAEDGSTVTPGSPLAKIKIGAEGAAAAAPPAAAATPTPAAEKKDEAAATTAAPAAVAAAAAAATAAKPAPASGPITETIAPPNDSATASGFKIPAAAVKPVKPAAAAAPPTGTPLVRMPPADPTTEIVGTRTEHRVKMNRMRLKIAQRLKDAQNTTAMLTTFNEIDMSGIMQLRKDNQDAFVKRHGLKLGFMSAFVKASAHALTRQPTVNAFIDDEKKEIVYRDFVDISVAVATPKGLVVPVLRNCQDMDYAAIEKGIAALGVKARDNKLAVEDMEGGTFTISNGGVFGSLFGTPIINPPQSAILGMHGVFDRPVVRDGQIVVRPMMYIALTYDHRLIDGREAVTFLRSIKAGVEDPRSMLLGL